MTPRSQAAVTFEEHFLGLAWELQLAVRNGVDLGVPTAFGPPGPSRYLLLSARNHLLPHGHS